MSKKYLDLNGLSAYDQKIKEYIDDGDVTIDNTLTQAGQAADAKKTGDELTDLKSAFDEDVGSKIESVKPNNWFDAEHATDGILHKDGTTEENNIRYYTDYIPVSSGDILRAYYINNMNLLSIVAVCAYDSSKNVLENSGTDTIATSFEVPSGVSFVRLTLGNYYTDNPWITINYTPASSSEYKPYFEPYKVIIEDFLTPESEAKMNSIPDGMGDVTVKGTNLIPISETGVGAYVRNGNSIVFFSSYTSYRYAIIDVKKNTRYYVNYNPRWWILTDGNDNVIDGAQYLTPASKRYIDTGNATKLYYSDEVASWSAGIIVAEGVTGTRDNLQQTSLLKPINQLMLDGWYACALSKYRIYFTVGINEKFYYKNILSLPEENTVDLKVSNMETYDEDGVFISVNAVGAFNNYLFTVYDQNLSIVEQNVNGQFGNRYADNVSNCSALLIGDSTIERDSAKIGQTLLDAFTARGKTITLLGTRGSGDNKNEGRSGWSAAGYCRTAESGGVTNAFYNPLTEGFDFSYYMTNQNYESVDFVVIQLGINDLYNEPLYSAKARIDTLIADMTTIINSIHAFNPDQKIILNLPTPCTAKTTGQYAMPTVQQKTMRAKFIYYNALMEVLSTGFKNVRCSHCHLILDPETEIADLIHPTTAGLEKMGMETLSQINCWQNA